MIEEWENIDLCKSYQVSNIGNVRSLDRIQKYRTGTTTTIKGKEMKKYLSIKGYVKVCLNSKKYNVINKHFSVHRLVALAFIPNTDNKPQVNHINGIKTDNRVENLEWCTHKENLIHAYKTGLLTKIHSFDFRRTSLTKELVLEIRNLIENERFSNRQISDKYNLSMLCIWQIKNRKTFKNI